MSIRRNHYLEQRGYRWYYVRRVPSRYRVIDKRRRVKVALLTDSLTIARERRDALMGADEQCWEMSLAKHKGTTVEERPERQRSPRRFCFVLTGLGPISTKVRIFELTIE